MHPKTGIQHAAFFPASLGAPLWLEKSALGSFDYFLRVSKQQTQQSLLGVAVSTCGALLWAMPAPSKHWQDWYGIPGVQASAQSTLPEALEVTSPVP